MTSSYPYTDRAHRQNGDGSTTCDCCGRLLAAGRTVWLESDQRIGGYHDYGNVPPEESNGCFPFGADCARHLLAEARAKAKAAGVFLGRRRADKVARAEMFLARKRAATPAVETATDTYPARGRLAGHGEIILPEGDGTAKTLLEQVRCLLDGRGSLDYCPTTGELIIRTGLDTQMGGDLVPLDSEDDE